MSSVERSAEALGQPESGAITRSMPARVRSALRSGITGALAWPGSYFVGPIFQREVRSGGRRRGTYITRCLYVFIVLLVMSLAYLAARSNSYASNTVGRIQELQQLAPVIGVALFWAQFILMILIAPILTAGAVCDEKRGRTLSAMMTTPLTSGQIIMGKLSARTVQLVILALCAVPVLLAIRVFGGLEASLIIAATLATISTALLVAAIGVLLSCWHNRASTVVMFAILVLGLIQAAPLTIFGILVSNDIIGETLPIALLGTCAPAVLFEVSVQSTGDSLLSGLGLDVSHFPGWWPWTALNFAAFNAIYNLLWILLICALASITLRRVMIAEAGGPAPGRFPVVDACLGIDKRGRFRFVRFLLTIGLPSILLLVAIGVVAGADVNLLGIIVTAFVLLAANVLLVAVAYFRSRRMLRQLAAPPPAAELSAATPRVCASCGYALVGLEPGAPCPECASDQARPDPGLPPGPADEVVFATSRDVGHRPVLWRELRQRTFGGQLVSLHLGAVSFTCVSMVAALIVSSWRVSDAKLRDVPSAFDHGGGDAIALLVKSILVLLVAVVGVVIAARGGVRLRFPIKMAYLAGAVFIAATYMYVVEGFDDTGLTSFIATIGAIGLILQASLMTTSGIAGERESRTWETLLTTSLSPREILTGKFLGALRRMMLIPGLVAAHLVLSMCFGSTHPLGAVTIMLTLLGPAIFLAGVGAFLSLTFRKSTRAAVANLAMALTIWGGSWLVLALFNIFGHYMDMDPYFDVNYALSPVGMSYAAADAFTADSIAYRFPSRHMSIEIWDHRSSIGEFVAITVGVFMAYAALGIGAVAGAIYLFPRFGGRSS